MLEPLRNDAGEAEFYGRYFGTLPEDCPNYLWSEKAEEETDIYLITFNHPFLVEYQIKTLRRFFRAPFNLIVVDNNCGMHPDSSRKVLEMCIREQVTYLMAPDNYYQHGVNFDPSMKLGTTMSWLYAQSVRARRPKYFGFLDHDCFLVKEWDPRPYLDEKGMYGKMVESKVSKAWTLHVTVNFYRLGFVGGRMLDFRASWKHQLDTGGANYDILYKGLRKEDYAIEHGSRRFAEQDVNRKDSVQHYEIIDGAWYHMCASSHDQLAGDGWYKLAYTKGYLDGKLEG